MNEKVKLGDRTTIPYKVKESLLKTFQDIVEEYRLEPSELLDEAFSLIIEKYENKKRKPLPDTKEDILKFYKGILSGEFFHYLPGFWEGEQGLYRAKIIVRHVFLDILKIDSIEDAMKIKPPLLREYRIHRAFQELSNRAKTNVLLDVFPELVKNIPPVIQESHVIKNKKTSPFYKLSEEQVEKLLTGKETVKLRRYIPIKIKADILEDAEKGMSISDLEKKYSIRSTSLKKFLSQHSIEEQNKNI